MGHCPAPCNSDGGATKIRGLALLSRQSEKWAMRQHHVPWCHYPRLLPHKIHWQPYTLPLLYCTLGCKSSNQLHRKHTACHHRWHYTRSLGRDCPQRTAQLLPITVACQNSLVTIKWCHVTLPKWNWRRYDPKSRSLLQCHVSHLNSLTNFFSFHRCLG